MSSLSFPTLKAFYRFRILPWSINIWTRSCPTKILLLADNLKAPKTSSLAGLYTIDHSIIGSLQDLKVAWHKTVYISSMGFPISLVKICYNFFIKYLTSRILNSNFLPYSVISYHLFKIFPKIDFSDFAVVLQSFADHSPSLFCTLQRTTKKIWSKYSQKRNCVATVRISTFMCLWDRAIPRKGKQKWDFRCSVYGRRWQHVLPKYNEHLHGSYCSRHYIENQLLPNQGATKRNEGAYRGRFLDIIGTKV